MNESTREQNAALIPGDGEWNDETFSDLTAIGGMCRLAEMIGAGEAIEVPAPRVHAAVTDS